jgi:hypothetical protein
MNISSTVVEEHIKFMNICWEYLGQASDLDSYLQSKSYLLQRKIKSWHEKLDYDKQETREKIVSWEYLLWFLLNEEMKQDYTIIATKSSTKKIHTMVWDWLQWLIYWRPVNNGI